MLLKLPDVLTVLSNIPSLRVKLYILQLTLYSIDPILGNQKRLCVLIESDKYVVIKSCVLIVMLKFLYGMETQI